MSKPAKLARKHSVVVAEIYEAALGPLDHLNPDDLKEAVRAYQAKQESTPEHIKVIQRLGILDAMRGYTDDDIARYLAARELAKRELSDPSDFLSQRTESAAQSERAAGPRKRSNSDYVEIWDYVAPKFRREEPRKSILIDAVEHFSSRPFSERKIERAIKWARTNPDQLSDDS